MIFSNTILYTYIGFIILNTILGDERLVKGKPKGIFTFV